jgi:hypothetical protein
MKTKLILALAATFLLLNVHAQSELVEDVPSAFLGISTGINNMNGMLGVTGEIRLVKNVSVFGAAGIGGWGTKATAGVKYYRNFPYGTHFGMSYSGAGGLDDFKIKVETETPGGEQEVTMDLEKAHTINMVIGYNWKLFKRSRFHLEFGYSVPLEEKPYTIKSGEVLSEKGEAVLDFMTPGGLIVGLGFSFGL